MNYSFSERGLTFAAVIIDKILKNGHKTAFIDELGPLELSGRGLFHSYGKMLKCDIDIYTVCRDIYVRPVTELFAISEFRVIN